MVVANKRRGCDVCRKRHVKCDREAPSCSQCRRAGWTCPGYPNDLAFVNYSQELPTGPAKPAIARGRDTRARDAKSRTSSSSPHEVRKADQKSSELVPTSPQSPPLLIAPASSADHARKQWIWGFEQKALPATFETQAIEPYLRFIPAYIGQSTALDATVRFLALASSLPKSQRNLELSEQPNPQLLRAYSASIRGLAVAIGDPQQVNTSATLAATLLLQLYETWCSKDSPRRALHANAVSRLIQHRGTDSFKDDFDLAILEAEIANISFSALRAGTSCYLASPLWTEIITNIAKDKSNGLGRYNRAQLDFLSAWTYIPGAVVGFHELLGLFPPDSEPANPPEIRCSATSDESVKHPSQHQSAQFEQGMTSLYQRTLAFRSQYLPIASASPDGAGGALNYKMTLDIGSGTLAIICCYILATVVPSRSAALIAEASSYVEDIRAYRLACPEHPFFANGAVRLAPKLAWIKLREHPAGLVSRASERIAEIVAIVYPP